MVLIGSSPLLLHVTAGFLACFAMVEGSLCVVGEERKRASKRAECCSSRVTETYEIVNRLVGSGIRPHSTDS